MMKSISVLLTITCITISCFCQQSSLDEFNQERLQISKKGLTALTAYASANIIYGAVASAQTNGATKYFHQMNAIWNGVTLGIVAVGKLTSKKEADFTLLQSLKAQNKIEKIFLFNTGLDLAYIASGAYLQERSKSPAKNPERLNGYGRSVMLQGAVLFLFDAVMYLVHHNHGKKLDKLAEKMQVGFTDTGIGIYLNLN